MPTAKPTIDQVLAQVTPITDAINEAARQALLDHKLVGNPVASWQNGRVVIVPPEDIRVPPGPPTVEGQDAA